MCKRAAKDDPCLIVFWKDDILTIQGISGAACPAPSSSPSPLSPPVDSFPLNSFILRLYHWKVIVPFHRSRVWCRSGSHLRPLSWPTPLSVFLLATDCSVRIRVWQLPLSKPLHGGSANVCLTGTWHGYCFELWQENTRTIQSTSIALFLVLSHRQ